MIFSNLVNINNSILAIFLTIVILLFIYYSLGSIVQNSYQGRIINYYLSVPIGYVTYLLITGITYFPIILLGLNNSMLTMVEALKNILIIIIIIFNYKIWLLNSIKIFNLNSIKTWLYTFLFILIGIVLYISLFYFSNWFMVEDTNSLIYQSMNNIYNDTSHYFSTSDESNKYIILERYESQYYWIVSISILSNLTLVNSLSWIIPITIIVVIGYIILSIFFNRENNLRTLIFSILIYMLMICIMGWFGSYNKMFYIWPIFIFFIFVLCGYSNQVKPNHKLFDILLLSLATYIFITPWGIMLLMMFGIPLILFSLQKNAFFVENLNKFLIALFVEMTFIFLLVLFQTDETLTNLIWYLILIIALLFLGVVPSNTLSYNTSKKNDLIILEQKLKSNLIILISIITLIIISIVVTFSFIINGSINHMLQQFFSIGFDDIQVSLLTYFLLIILPTSIILILMYFKIEFPIFMNVIVLINIIFMNPFSFIIITSFSNTEPNLLVVYIPTISLILIGSIEIIFRKINII